MTQAGGLTTVAQVARAEAASDLATRAALCAERVLLFTCVNGIIGELGTIGAAPSFRYAVQMVRGLRPAKSFRVDMVWRNVRGRAWTATCFRQDRMPA